MCVRACQTALKSPWKGILGGRPNFHVFSITVEKLRPRGYSGLLSGTQWVNSRRLGRLAGCIGVEKKMLGGRKANLLKTPFTPDPELTAFMFNTWVVVHDLTTYVILI